MEQIIAYHCAPALAGIKPANLVACYKNKIQNIHSEIRRLNQELNGSDIYFEVLCECEKRVLVMAYRRSKLEQRLLCTEIQDFLAGFGYPAGASVDVCIAHLKTRLTGEWFPHEIGAFLGYPLHDIYGFIQHKDQGCLLCGEWKVYHNVEEAKKLFKRFSDCRRAVAKRLCSGKTLVQVFRAA